MEPNPLKLNHAPRRGRRVIGDICGEDKRNYMDIHRMTSTGQWYCSAVHEHSKTHFPPIWDSTMELTYCPVYIRNFSVFSEWNCRSNVMQPAMNGGPSIGSFSEGFLQRRLPVGWVDKCSLLKMFFAWQGMTYQLCDYILTWRAGISRKGNWSDQSHEFQLLSYKSVV